MIRNGEMELKNREEEIRFLKMEVSCSNHYYSHLFAIIFQMKPKRVLFDFHLSLIL